MIILVDLTAYLTKDLMQALHKISPQDEAQERALEELREYYLTIDEYLFRNYLIAKATGFFFATAIFVYNIFSFKIRLELNESYAALTVSTICFLLATVVAWFGGQYTAQTFISYLSKRNPREITYLFKEKLRAVFEQYVGKILPGDVVQMHLNGKFINGGFFGLTEIHQPVIVMTILRHEKLENGYQDTGPLHLSFEEDKIQLWAGTVQKKKSRIRS